MDPQTPDALWFLDYCARFQIVTPAEIELAQKHQTDDSPNWLRAIAGANRDNAATPQGQAALNAEVYDLWRADHDRDNLPTATA